MNGMRVIQFPVLFDNYAYVLVCEETRAVAVIDTPDAGAIIKRLKEVVDFAFTSLMILNTHHHWDHAGGNEGLLQAYKGSVFASSHDQKRIFGVTDAVIEGTEVSFGSTMFRVLTIPGHTLGHVAYYTEGTLFCGDTLFVGGCGRLFEGSPEQMVASLKKISVLPDATKIYCGHEYTQKNLEFAMGWEPGNRELQKKREEVSCLRARGVSTVPSTLAEERLYNPFLRLSSPEILLNLRRRGGKDLDSEVKVFAALRALKDVF